VESDKEFQKCIPFILEKEGGYVNHPNDPGGETKYGISKRAYPNVDIKNLTIEQAKRIYYNDYWLRGASSLSWPLNLCFFDCAVNQGTGRAKKFLADMEQSKKDWKYFLELRREHYLFITEKNPKFKAFIKGWLNRINAVKKFIEEQSS
jgi:lysozyme family protein